MLDRDTLSKQGSNYLEDATPEENFLDSLDKACEAVDDDQFETLAKRVVETFRS